MNPDFYEIKIGDKVHRVDRKKIRAVLEAIKESPGEDLPAKVDKAFAKHPGVERGDAIEFEAKG